MAIRIRTGGIIQLTLRIVCLGVIDALVLFSIFTFIGDGNYALALIVCILTVSLNIVFLSGKLYPYKWFAPGLILMTIMLVYPTLGTVYTAFTNYGDGHILSKVQALEHIQKVTYLPEGAGNYSWTAYRNTAGEFALWLQDDEGRAWFALPDQPVRAAEELDAAGVDVGSRDADGIPESLPGAQGAPDTYRRVNRIEALQLINSLSTMSFGQPPRIVSIQSLDSAQERVSRYNYNTADDTITDRTDGKLYQPVEGTFTADDGSIIRPGFSVVVGTQNFARLITSPSLRGPFVRVFVWTFIFAGVSVLFSFAFGLFFAIIFDHPRMKAKRLVRSLLLIPYAIPAFISVNIWRGMFQRHIGVITIFLENTFGSSPLWLSDPLWAKIGIIIIQTWLGYPYMMLICTGALQSLPREIYEAARIDGANPLQRFWNLTLPLLLVAVGPLLIASFAFNFNNFTVIDIYSEGGPPIANTATPAGHTDILITYIFRLAFSGGRGADFGYASAVTIIIFIILATITALQFRYTKVWEEISENV
ncbi:MAG: maltose ABC transporter permease MalF [Salinispira sp.]